MNNQEERKRVCCNCGNNLRIRNQHLGIHNECAIDGHYISYSDCFEGWCRHWKTEETKTAVIPIGMHGEPMGIVLCMKINNEEN